MEIIGYFILLISGVTLALVGGGGSLISTPVLIYFFKMDALQATTYSLFVVALSSSVGTYKHLQKKHIDFLLALEFALPCFVSIFIVRNYILPQMPFAFEFLSLKWTRDIAIMLPFGLLMCLSAAKSLFQQKKNTQPQQRSKVTALLQGFFIGALTGFVGIGGGFIITPILHFVMGIEFKKAVGTSLFVLTLNATFGFLVDASNGALISYSLLSFFALASAIGLVIGFQIAKHIKEDKIKLSFSILLIIIAAVVIGDYSWRLAHLNS